MAATAYAVSAALLVFYFGEFDKLINSSFKYTAIAATYDESDFGSEEIKKSEEIIYDNTEYTLFNPYTNILQQTETLLNHPMEEYVELFSIDEEEVEETTVRSDERIQDTLEKVENMSQEALATANIDVPSNLSLTYNKAMRLTLSEDEMEVLYRIVEAEATGEDIFGKILVANVVINRVNTSEFPDTISEVVFQSVGKAVQFSPTKDGRYYTVKVTQSTKEAVKRALSGEDYSQGALYFFARKLTTTTKAKWFDTSLRKVLQYGCHEFYANK